MEKFDPRVDAYIAKAADYAQPILNHIRQLVHDTSPDVMETMKWSCPHFDHKGGPFVSMAAFKGHVGLGFWKSSLMDDPNGLFKADGSAGSIGKIRSVADLPADDVLKAYFKNAMALNDQGIKITKKVTAPKAELPVPDDLIAAFKINQAALQHFEQFSPSGKREYLEWLAEAKSETTRSKRLETMMEWVAEGKTRHWKYK